MEQRCSNDFSAKTSNLRHCGANHGTRIERIAEDSWLRTGPPPLEAGRQAGDSQSRKARGKFGPRDGIPY